MAVKDIVAYVKNAWANGGTPDISAQNLLKIDNQVEALTNTIRNGTLQTDTVLTGTPTAPIAAEGTNTTQLATTSFVDRVRATLASAISSLSSSVSTALGLKANIASPNFTGTASGAFSGTINGLNISAGMAPILNGNVLNSAVIVSGASWIIPAGLYLLIPRGLSGNEMVAQLQYYNGTSWRNEQPYQNFMGMIISDGTNFRITNPNASGVYMYYHKYA